MRSVIFANGLLPPSFKAASFVRSEDLIIAVDGGVRHLQGESLHPHVVVGDMDSISADQMEALAHTGTRMMRYPVRKDQIDLELALDYALKAGAAEIIVVGALGGRWDMSVANIMLLTKPDFAHVLVRFLYENQEILLIRAGHRQRIGGNEGDTLSLIPLGGDAEGVTATGVAYPLENDVLKFGLSRGVSNMLTEKYATIAVAKGVLLCVLIHL